MNTIAILSTLCLFEAAILPGGTVVRSSLFGYTVSGVVLDMGEAAERVGMEDEGPDVAAEPASAVSGVGGVDTRTESPIEGPRSFPPAAHQRAPGPRTDGADDGVADAPTQPTDCDGPCEEGRPCRACAIAYAAQVDAEMPVEPTEATARVCLECNGGARHRKHGCHRCNGRAIRVWIDGHEIGQHLPETEEDRLGAALAICSILREIPETAAEKARDFFDAILQGAERETRRIAREEWDHAAGGGYPEVA